MALSVWLAYKQEVVGSRPTAPTEVADRHRLGVAARREGARAGQEECASSAWAAQSDCYRTDSYCADGMETVALLGRHYQAVRAGARSWDEPSGDVYPLALGGDVTRVDDGQVERLGVRSATR